MARALAPSFAAFVVVTLLGGPAASAPLSGPPFDTKAVTPHRIAFTVDTGPARDVLDLVTRSPEAPAVLKRLRANPHLEKVLDGQGITTENFFGRLVSAAAGTPEPLLAAFAAKAELYRSVLDAFDKDANGAATLEARRISSVLPPEPAAAVSFQVMPFFGVSGFSEVLNVKTGDGAAILVVDLPRVMDSLMSPTPREVLLKALRASAAEAWRSTFTQRFRVAPAWPEESATGFDALLARTVAEGPSTLFLIPDEFFPLALLEEPIGRAFDRWNAAAEKLLDPKKHELDRRDILLESTYGDFWARYTAIVGAQMTDVLVRLAGRDAYLAALTKGPRAVAALYVKTTKGKKIPTFGKSALKALEN